ncbi:EG45-like domain containing protein [Teratosphaeria destructans]|uniref:EG45-like domain containing protein n=1 Tax=Teratosphaeria destructans TaxID=418781 RepID=A0A9W7STY6_9PEZI|nr:EG45-like domain containing protein [Teratosphaeria destructans]
MQQNVITIVLALYALGSRADVATAGVYPPPYQGTECYGSDPSQFPSSNLFGCASEGVWDNGAACGRQYLVRCISATQSGTCIPQKTIQIRIIDRCGPGSQSGRAQYGGTIVLTTTAMSAIAHMEKLTSRSPLINIEFQQV